MTKITVQDLAARVGKEIAISEWLLISQQRIEDFANATNDRQWIHVDVVRAAREAPGGKTIAHGFLTLSLAAGFADESFQVSSVRYVVNCGLNRVRFIAPVLVGSQLRARFFLEEFRSLDKHSVQVSWRVTLECQGCEKPACIADLIYRYYF